MVATAGGDQETAGDPSEPRVQPGREPEGNSGARHWSGAQRRGWAVAQSRGGATEGGAGDAIEVTSAKGGSAREKGPWWDGSQQALLSGEEYSGVSG